MLNYILLLTLLVLALAYGLGELGESVKSGFDSVNEAVSIINIQHNKG